MPRSQSEPKPDPDAASPKPSLALTEARLRQQAIGSRLRELFDEVVNEPVPEEFLNILRRADTPDEEGDQ